MRINIVEAGVDSNHQTSHCDWCGHIFPDCTTCLHIDEEGDCFYECDDLPVSTCTHTEYVTLCDKCYRKAGNKVR